MPTPVRLSLSGLVLAALFVGPAGCRRDEEAVHETIVRTPTGAGAMGQPAGVPRFKRAVADDGSGLPPGHPAVGEQPPSAATPAAPAAPMGGGAAPSGMVGDVPPPPPVEKGAGLHWTLPNGWTESRNGGMRYATLKPAGDAKVDVSVVVLGGAAGGELSNVNRWRGQLGLAPVDEAGMASLKKAVATKAGAVSLFSFESTDTKSRMLVGYLFANGSTWFVKMTGEASAVNGASGEFTKLLKTLSFE